MHFMKTFIFNPHSSIAKKALLVNVVGSVLPYNSNSKWFFHEFAFLLLQIWIQKIFLTFCNEVIIVGNTAKVTTECCTFGTKVWKLTAMLLLKNFYHTAQFINDGHGLNFFRHWTWHDRRLVMSWSLNIGTQCALEKW